MEVRTDGLYLDGARLTRAQAWANIAKALGSPTRTNEFMKGPRKIFAYDHHGILLYGESPEATDSIVVDFEGSGGTNGTSHPFPGSLQVVGHAIENGKDSASAMRELKLNKPKPDSLVFSAEYDGTDVIFSYDNPKKLSIVEIVLK